MRCRGSELATRDVVCIRDGRRVNCGCDLEFDPNTALVTAVILPGKKRFFGLFGRENDTIIPWQYVKVIGSDTVLVDFDLSYRKNRPKGSFFENLLG